MENGVKQYRQAWPTKRGAWELSFKNRTLTETLAIKAFFEAKLGRATAFTWTCPTDSTEYTVRFASDNFSYQYIGYQLCDFQIKFEEDTA